MNKIPSLKKADRETAEKLFEAAPPDWDMERVFKKSCQRAETASFEAEDVLECPVEKAPKRSGLFMYVSGLAACLLLAALPAGHLLRSHNVDDGPDAPEEHPVMTQICLTTVSASVSSTTIRSSGTTEKFSATGNTASVTTSAVTVSDSAEAGSEELYEEPEEPASEPEQTQLEESAENEVPTESIAADVPETITPPPTEQPKEYEPVPRYTGERPDGEEYDEYIRMVAQGMLDGKYFCDFNGNGRWDPLDCRVIFDYYVNTVSTGSPDYKWQDGIFYRIMQKWWYEKYKDFLDGFYIEFYADDEIYISMPCDGELLYENVMKYGDVDGRGDADFNDYSLMLQFYDAAHGL